jgi:hypothetical protein
LHEFPSQHVGPLQELAARLVDSRKPGTDLGTLARELLFGFHDICMRFGLDGLLVALAQTFPPLDIDDRAGLADHPVVQPALLAQLNTIDLDGGGPRAAKPRQLADCVIAALQLTVADETDRMIVP